MADVSDLGWVREVVANGSSIRGDCAFVGGSAARGWANEGSDVDVYVLGSPEARSEIVAGDGHRPSVDIHAMTRDHVEDLFARVGWDAAARGNEFVGSFSDREWLMFERIHHAHPLSGHDVLEDYRRRLAASAHRYMLTQDYFTMADAYADDCLGQLSAGDTDSSVLSGQLSYLRAVDGVVASTGCYARGPKWRARAMQEARPQIVAYGDFWAVVTMAELPAIGRAAWSLRQVEQARDLMSRVDLADFSVVGDD